MNAYAKIVRLSGILACAIALGACPQERVHSSSDTRPDVALTVTALTGGNAVDEEEQIAAGLVKLSSTAGSCSGTLVTHHWIITPSHCLCDESGNPPAITVSQGTRTQGVFNYNSTYNDGAPFDSADMAAVRGNELFPLPEPQKLWPKAASALVGETVTCYAGDGATAMRFDAMIEAADQDFGRPDTSGATCTVTAVNARGLSAVLPSGVTLDPADLGGPCYKLDTETSERFLVGMLAKVSSTDATRVIVVPTEAFVPFLAYTSDIWKASACDAPVPGSQFTLDPFTYLGVPVANGVITFTAEHAFDEPGTPRTVLAYNSGYRFGQWTSIPAPAFARGTRGVAASVDPDPNPWGASGHNLLELMYLDNKHQQHALWYDADGTKKWLQRDNIEATEEFVDFDGIGASYSKVRPRAPLDLSVRMPLFIAADGRVGISHYLVSDSGNKWVDMFVPANAPLADARKRPSLIMHAFTQDIVAGYHDREGHYVIYKGNRDRVTVDHKSSVWYSKAAVITDLPPNMRDIALGVTGGTSAVLYWAVTVDQDGEMQQWQLDLANGHATNFGKLGARALGTVKTVPFAPLYPYEELMIAYTAEDWSARVRPTFNCLGNDPPGF